MEGTIHKPDSPRIKVNRRVKFAIATQDAILKHHKMKGSERDWIKTYLEFSQLEVNI